MRSMKQKPGAKRPSYSIVFDAEDLTQFFTDVCITQENGIPYLNAQFKGHRTVCERMLALDAERYQKGELPLSNMLNKYCSYLMARDQKKLSFSMKNYEIRYDEGRKKELREKG